MYRSFTNIHIYCLLTSSNAIKKVQKLLSKFHSFPIVFIYFFKVSTVHVVPYLVLTIGNYSLL